jgi:GNAT superfamily N-acetyltransferase
MIIMDNMFEIKQATITDAPLILDFIKELAEYEKLSHAVSATETVIKKNLFGNPPAAEVIIGYLNKTPVSFAIFFYNFSSFSCRPGLYIEDIFVKSHARGQGIGQKMFTYLAHLAHLRQCGRMEWSVLDWNELAISFYKKLSAFALDEWTVYRLTGNALEDLALSWENPNNVK